LAGCQRAWRRCPLTLRVVGSQPLSSSSSHPQSTSRHPARPWQRLLRDTSGALPSAALVARRPGQRRQRNRPMRARRRRGARRRPGARGRRCGCWRRGRCSLRRWGRGGRGRRPAWLRARRPRLRRPRMRCRQGLAGLPRGRIGSTLLTQVRRHVHHVHGQHAGESEEADQTADRERRRRHVHGQPTSAPTRVSSPLGEGHAAIVPFAMQGSANRVRRGARTVRAGALRPRGSRVRQARPRLCR